MVYSEIGGANESEYNAPVLFVRKKGGSFRMCVDYRLLNLAVIQRQFNMPILENLAKEVAGHKYYSSLDMIQSFHQIRLTDSTRHVTAFSALGRKYCYNVLPFGFTNAPAILQEVVQELIEDIPGCVDYMDDIIVYSNNVEEHRDILNQMFQRFQKHKFYFMSSKCHLGQSSVDFLGHRVGLEGVSIPDDQLDAIRKTNMPTNSREMRLVLGFFNFFGTYVRNFSDIAASLFKIFTTKNVSHGCTAQTV